MKNIYIYVNKIKILIKNLNIKINLHIIIIITELNYYIKYSQIIISVKIYVLYSL